MKRILFFSFIIFFPVIGLYSQQSTFVYVEGEVAVKKASGELLVAQISDILNIGDSIITGEDGYAELSLENNSSITINSDTVFIYSKKEKKGKKKNIFMVVLGNIKFKFDRLLHEPDIQTPATVAGIRGTEFSVLSGLDGTSFYIVEEGEVAVEAEGSLVVLSSEEGVEVPIGEIPGEKFEVKIGKVDFSGWLDEGDQNFKSDPAGTLRGITEKLVYFGDEANEFFQKYDESFKELSELRLELDSIEKAKGSEAKGKFYNEEIFPKEMITSNFVLNYRYYALSALSLRRYVLSSMYIDMKTSFILDNRNVLYTDFLEEYESFLKIYEEKVVQYLVEADI